MRWGKIAVLLFTGVVGLGLGLVVGQPWDNPTEVDALELDDEARREEDAFNAEVRDDDDDDDDRKGTRSGKRGDGTSATDNGGPGTTSADGGRRGGGTSATDDGGPGTTSATGGGAGGGAATTFTNGGGGGTSFSGGGSASGGGST